MSVAAEGRPQRGWEQPMKIKFFHSSVEGSFAVSVFSVPTVEENDGRKSP